MTARGSMLVSASNHQWEEDGLVYAFGQVTLGTSGDISRNDRVGVGAEFGLTDTIAISGEVSYGSHGVGALAGVTFDPNPDEHYYAGYRLDPAAAFDINKSFELLDDENGTFVVGLKRRLDEVASAYAETSYDRFGASAAYPDLWHASYARPVERRCRPCGRPGA